MDLTLSLASLAENAYQVLDQGEGQILVAETRRPPTKKEILKKIDNIKREDSLGSLQFRDHVFSAQTNKTFSEFANEEHAKTYLQSKLRENLSTTPLKTRFERFIRYLLVHTRLLDRFYITPAVSKALSAYKFTITRGNQILKKAHKGLFSQIEQQILGELGYTFTDKEIIQIRTKVKEDVLPKAEDSEDSEDVLTKADYWENPCTKSFIDRIAKDIILSDGKDSERDNSSRQPSTTQSEASSPKSPKDSDDQKWE